MNVRNPWVGYLDRNYTQIKNRILQRMGETIPEMTDHSSSNIMVVAIEAYSGVAEMLNYYIDNMAREAFITTARRFSSVVKHTRLIDYRIKARIPASADVLVRFKISNEYAPAPSNFTIPIGTKLTTSNGVEFLLIKDILVQAGMMSVSLPVRQQTLFQNEPLGLTTNDPNQTIALGNNYVHNSLELSIDGEAWLLQRTLGLSGPLDKHVVVDISANQEAYIVFGDNINGAIPLPNLPVTANYYTSLGRLGNVDAQTINQIQFNFNIHGIDSVEVYNPLAAVGGTDYEDIERIRRSAPLSIRTLDRAVTRQDYIDIALLAPGVDKAALYFECGKTVDLYIAPNGGGIASTVLLNSVVDFFDTRKMVTTFVRALAAGESYLFIDLTVTGRFRVNGNQLRQEVIDLLLENYNYEASDINKAIRISDLYALVDNYKRVDYLKINKIYLKPYIRPSNNLIAINYDITLNQGSTQVVNWKIKFDGLFMKLFKENAPVANLTIGTPYTDLMNILTITINPGVYVVGHEWIFKTLPINTDITPTDFSVPVLIEENIELNIIEQTSL